MQGFFPYLCAVMLEKTRGIVLRTIRYSDAALIADIYTESRGAQGFLVPVSRSRKSVVRNVLLSPLTLLELEVDYRENRKLQRLADVRVDEPYRSVPYQPVKETIALFLGEFLYYALRNEQANPPLYQFLLHSMLWLDEREGRLANFPVTLLVRLTRFLGIWPSEEEASRLLLPREQQMAPLLLRMTYATMHLFRFTSEERGRLMQGLNDYYRQHVPGFPELRSMAILREVLS